MNIEIPISVVFVSHDAGRGGAQRLLLTLLRWLCDTKKIRCRIVLRRGGPLADEFYRLGPVFDVEPLLSEHPEVLKAKLLDFCAPASVAYINTLVPGDIAEMLAQLRIPIVTHAHEMEQAIRRWCVPEQLESLLRITDSMIAVSPPVAENLQRSHGVAADRIFTIHGFIDCRGQETDSFDPRQIRIDKQLPADGVIVFGCGTMDWRKGPDLFVEVAGKTIRELNLRNAHFFWIGAAGSEAETRGLQEKIDALGLSPNIKFLGELPEPAEYFRAGDLFLLTSREDPYPLVCLEAALCGLPVVCFDQIGGIPDFVKADAGYVVPFGDTAAMAEKVALLAAQPVDRQARGAVARQRVLLRHDVATAGEQILQVILSQLLQHQKQILQAANQKIDDDRGHQRELRDEITRLEEMLKIQARALEQREAALEALRENQRAILERERRATAEKIRLAEWNASLEAKIRASALELEAKERAIGAVETERSVFFDKAAKLEAALGEAEAAIMTRDQRIRAMESAQSGLAWRLVCRYRGLKDRCFPAGSRRRSFYDRCLAVVKSAGPDRRLRDPQEGGFPPAVLPGNFWCSIDSLTARAGRIYGWGWLLHKTRAISALHLLARTKTGRHLIRCQYGVARDDVARTHEHKDAYKSGFLILDRLPRERVTELFLEVELEDGESVRIDCPEFRDIVERLQRSDSAVAAPGALSGLRRIVHLGRRGIAYVGRRDWKGLQSKFHKTLERSNALANSLPPFSLPEFLEQIGAGKNDEVVLLIDHNLGGGANIYRAQVIEQNLDQNRQVVLLFYNLWRLRYCLTFLERGREFSYELESLDLLLPLAKSLRIREIFLNNTVSFDDPLIFTALLPQLKRLTGAEFTVAIHDYFALCPSWNLLDDRGRSCGVPDLNRCRQCLPNLREPLSFWVDIPTIDRWRQLWGSCLQEATRILCFSRSSIELLRKAYPDLDPATIQHQPHTLENFPKKPIRYDVKSPLHIGIIGEITIPKGAGIVADMVRLIEERQLPVKITVIGSIDNLTESSSLSITGPYARLDLPEILGNAEANVAFVPSIWPETFSYVTAELMEMGLPVACFDLGAQGERVRTYRKGLVIDTIDAAAALEQLMAFHEKLGEDDGTGLKAEKRSEHGCV